MVSRKAIQSGIGKIEATRCGDEAVLLPVYEKRKTNREVDGDGGDGDWQRRQVCRGARLLSRIIARLVSRLREAVS